MTPRDQFGWIPSTTKFPTIGLSGTTDCVERMRVLVTGAAGFIGSHVVRKLVREGHTVYGVVRKNTAKERVPDCLSRMQSIEVDLRDVESVRYVVSDIQPECAIHLAWYVVPNLYWTASENLDCVAMSVSLAQMLAESGCKKLVAAGSCAEYDWDYGYLSEEVTPLRPHTLYGACKNATRQLLQAYCDQVSMKFAWMRFFHLYGPGERNARLVPTIVSALLSGQTAKCTLGEKIRDFLHVEDAASAVWAVVESDLTGPVNIASGEPLKIRVVVEALGRILEAGDKILLGALPPDPSEPPFLVADVQRLKLLTSWTPVWKLEEGLRQVVSCWKQKRRVLRGAL